MRERASTQQFPNKCSAPVAQPPLVTRAQVQSYLGVEHRVESIHIDVFTHQLQEATGRGVRRGQGRREGASWASLASSGGQEQRKRDGLFREPLRLGQDQGLAATQNWTRELGPGYLSMLQRVPKARRWGTGTQENPCGGQTSGASGKQGPTLAIWTTLGNSVRQEMGMTSWYVRHLVLGGGSPR